MRHPPLKYYLPESSILGFDLQIEKTMIIWRLLGLNKGQVGKATSSSMPCSAVSVITLYNHGVRERAGGRGRCGGKPPRSSGCQQRFANPNVLGGLSETRPVGEGGRWCTFCCLSSVVAAHTVPTFPIHHSTEVRGPFNLRVHSR